MPNPFLDPIVARAAATPHHLFSITHDGTAWSEFTIGALLQRALQWTALLQSRSVAAGSTIMLVLRHGSDAPACFIGSMLAGMVPSFLPCPSSKQDHALYWAQHKTVLDFNRPPIVLVPDDLLADMTQCAATSGAAVLPLSMLDATAAIAPPTILPDPDTVGLLQHSSGTTGMKKGVALSYGSIARQLTAYRDSLGMDATRARIVSWLPLYHDMGLISSFLLPIWLGVPIISIDPFVWVAQPDLYLDGIEQFGATHGWLPNFAFLHMARRVKRKGSWQLSSLAALISCSEPCKATAFDVFVERFAAMGIKPEILQTCYAMAETVFAVSQSAVGHSVRRLAVDPDCIKSFGPVRPPADGAEPLILLSNGRPLHGCRVGLLHEGAPSPSTAGGHLGEICVAADYMFSGYHNNPTATEAAFQETWYRTGDIGFIDQGEVFVVGRLKDVIIVNGKNVFVHDIEAAVSTVAGVKPGRCVAFGRYSEKSGSELLIVVAEREQDQTADRDITREINRAVVDETGVPCADIRLVDQGWLVKTTSGKTSRSENAVKYDRQFVVSAT